MSYQGFKEFWSDLSALEYTPLENIQSEILQYLEWCERKDAEIDILRKALKGIVNLEGELTAEATRMMSEIAKQALYDASFVEFRIDQPAKGEEERE